MNNKIKVEIDNINKKMKLIKKQLNIEVKDFNEEEGTIRVIVSSGMPDRQGDMIDQSSWNFDEFRKNPVVLEFHDHTKPPIGQAPEIGINSDGMTEALIRFAINEYDRAKLFFKLYAGKFMRAVSAGFISNKIDEVNGIRILKDNVLYEFSVVNVGADALALAKTKGIDISLLEKIEEEKEIKPYPTEHSCRLEDPGKYDRFARKNCEIKHDGKCIDVIYGIKENKSEIQAYRYDKKVWTASSAKNHCKEHDGSFEPASEEEGKKKICKECIEKEGRVLSTKNRGIIEKAKDALIEVLKVDEASRANRQGKRKMNYKKILSKAIRELIEVRNE